MCARAMSVLTHLIKERENKKLQQSNLPKYYWKYLVEDM